LEVPEPKNDSAGEVQSVQDGVQDGEIEEGSVTTIYNRIRDTIGGDDMATVRTYLTASLLISEASGTVYHMSIIYSIFSNNRPNNRLLEQYIICPLFTLSLHVISAI